MPEVEIKIRGALEVFCQMARNIIALLPPRCCDTEGVAVLAGQIGPARSGLC